MIRLVHLLDYPALLHLFFLYCRIFQLRRFCLLGFSSTYLGHSVSVSIFMCSYSYCPLSNCMWNSSSCLEYYWYSSLRLMIHHRLLYVLNLFILLSRVVLCLTMWCCVVSCYVVSSCSGASEGMHTSTVCNCRFEASSLFRIVQRMTSTMFRSKSTVDLPQFSA